LSPQRLVAGSGSSAIPITSALNSWASRRQRGRPNNMDRVPFAVAAKVCAALTLLSSVASNQVFGQSEVGTLNVEIRDQASGQIAPAMICITSLADNTWRIPPDGRSPAGYVTNRDIIEGRAIGIDYVMGTQKKWSPGEPGPAVLMNGDFK